MDKTEQYFGELKTNMARISRARELGPSVIEPYMSDYTDILKKCLALFNVLTGAAANDGISIAAENQEETLKAFQEFFDSKMLSERCRLCESALERGEFNKAVSYLSFLRQGCVRIALEHEGEVDPKVDAKWTKLLEG